MDSCFSQEHEYDVKHCQACLGFELEVPISFPTIGTIMLRVPSQNLQYRLICFSFIVQVVKSSIIVQYFAYWEKKKKKKKRREIKGHRLNKSRFLCKWPVSQAHVKKKKKNKKLNNQLTNQRLKVNVI